MTDKEKLENIKKLADKMCHSAEYLKSDASYLHKAIYEYRQFIIQYWNDEEPVSEDLEEAAYRYSDDIYEKNRNKYNPDWNTYSDGYENAISCHVSDAVIYGANWQKEQMMKDAVEGTYDCNDTESWISFNGWIESTSKVGDKVKVLIIKEVEK